MSDLSKWNRKDWRLVPFKLKGAFQYVYDTADSAGLWHPDFEMMSMRLGVEVTELEFLAFFQDRDAPERVHVVPEARGAYLVPAVIVTQYGWPLNEDSNAHKPAREAFELYGLERFMNPRGRVEEGYPKGTGTHHKNKNTNTRSEEGGCGGKNSVLEFPSTKRPPLDFEALYRIYPKAGRKGKTDALLRFREQIRTPEQYADLKRAIEAEADYHARDLGKDEFRPQPKHFSTFMSKGRWRDCLEPGYGEPPKPETGGSPREIVRFKFEVNGEEQTGACTRGEYQKMVSAYESGTSSSPPPTLLEDTS